MYHSFSFCIALKSESDEYFFQGGSNATSFEVSGVTFSYQIVQSGEEYREELTATGPLTAPLIVEVRTLPPGVTLCVN